MMAMAFAIGQTAIIVPVGAAEPIVGRWRTRFDPAAAAGVPAHVTIIYPFLPGHDIDDNVVREFGTTEAQLGAVAIAMLALIGR